MCCAVCARLYTRLLLPARHTNLLIMLDTSFFIFLFPRYLGVEGCRGLPREYRLQVRTRYPSEESFTGEDGAGGVGEGKEGGKFEGGRGAGRGDEGDEGGGGGGGTGEFSIEGDRRHFSKEAISEDQRTGEAGFLVNEIQGRGPPGGARGGGGGRGRREGGKARKRKKRRTATTTGGSPS